MRKMCTDEVYVCLEGSCCAESVFFCLMRIGREHKRYWWTISEVDIMLAGAWMLYWVGRNVTGGQKCNNIGVTCGQ